MENPKKNLAAIDIGTNSFHLVIAEVNTETGRFKILGKEKENGPFRIRFDRYEVSFRSCDEPGN